MGQRSRGEGRHSTGAFVVLVGPDGVGKTTIASELIESYAGCTGYFHFRPPFWSRLRPGPDLAADGSPKTIRGGLTAAGWARIFRSFVMFWLGYMRRVRPAVRRGCLVVADRWGYGYLAQPAALGFHGPRWLALALVRRLPQPDLVVALEASPEIVVSRKDELGVDEVAREIETYRALPVSRLLVVDTAKTVADGVEAIRAALGSSGGW